MSFKIYNIVYQSNLENIYSTAVTTKNLECDTVITSDKITSDTINVAHIVAISAADGVTIEGVTVKMDTLYSGGLSLKSSNTKKDIKLIAPPNLAAPYTITLPDDMGSSGFVLATDGVDKLYWTLGGGGGGSSTFLDNAFQIIKHTDVKQHISFDASALSSSRVITMPDTNVNLSFMPDQSVSKTSSPTFNTVITNYIKERTPGSGVSLLKSDSKKIVSAKPNAVYFYDDNEVCFKSIHGYIGTIPSGAGTFKVCDINFTTPSVSYLDIYAVVNYSATVDILSTQDVVVYTGAVPLTIINVLDVSKQIGLYYSTSPTLSSVVIECPKDPVLSKTYNCNVTIRPTTGNYTVTFY